MMPLKYKFEWSDATGDAMNTDAGEPKKSFP